VENAFVAPIETDHGQIRLLLDDGKSEPSVQADLAPTGPAVICEHKMGKAGLISDFCALDTPQ
jgi:hypothetical protein